MMAFVNPVTITVTAMFVAWLGYEYFLYRR